MLAGMVSNPDCHRSKAIFLHLVSTCIRHSVRSCAGLSKRALFPWPRQLRSIGQNRSCTWQGSQNRLPAVCLHNCHATNPRILRMNRIDLNRFESIRFDKTRPGTDGLFAYLDKYNQELDPHFDHILGRLQKPLPGACTIHYDRYCRYCMCECACGYVITTSLRRHWNDG